MSYTSQVPADLSAMLADYQNLIYFRFRKAIKHLPDPAVDLEDLLHDLIVKVLREGPGQFLDDCRAYEAEKVAEGKPYSFKTIVGLAAERYAKNHLRNTLTQKRDPRKARSLHSYELGEGDQPTNDRCSKTVPVALQTPADQERAALHAARFQRVRAQLAGRVIGGLSAVEVLDTALATGELAGYAKRRLADIVKDV